MVINTIGFSQIETFPKLSCLADILQFLHDIISGLKPPGASGRPTGQHMSPLTRPSMNIRQGQGVEPASTMEGLPHDGWIDSTTTCRPTPPLPFTPQTENIYLHNVQNGEPLTDIIYLGIIISQLS